MSRKIQAQLLYMQGATQKEIAAAVGVSDRTVWTWIHQYSWDKLRLAALQAPAIISDNLCSQIVELQNVIASRPIGSRYPTMQEAGVMQKLIAMLEKMKKTPSLSQNMQMLETFRNYVRPIEPEFAKKLAGHAERFLEGQSINGYAPYQSEYGVGSVPPVMPLFPETEEEEVEEKIYSAADRVVRYHIPPMHYQPRQDIAATAGPSTEVEEKPKSVSTPSAVDPSLSAEEKSQSLEVPSTADAGQRSAIAAPQRSGLPWQKKNRSAVALHATTATPEKTPLPINTSDRKEPEDCSQLRPTG